MHKTITAQSKVLDYLTGKIKSYTAEEIATRTKLDLNTTRNALGTLKRARRVKVVGTVSKNKLGRPANKYAAV